MKKLIVYPNEQAFHDLAGSYPCLVNFDYVNKFAEFDDGCGNTMHIDFKVTDKPDVHALAVGYDAVEFVGFGG